MNWNFVTPRLATGAAIGDLADVQALVSAGITHIIDCRVDVDDGILLAQVPGLAYLWNPTADDGQPKVPAWFQKSLEFALPALVRPHARVYAHCHNGINRGPSTAYAIMRALGFGRMEAQGVIRLKRPQALIRYASDADRAITYLGYD